MVQKFKEISASDTNGKKAAIIESAVKLFSQQGYHNTRMEAIAAEAGIGKGTIYEYFSSKAQLFKEMMELTAQRYYDSLGEKPLEDLDFSQQLKLIIKAHFSFCQQNKEFTRLLFWENDVLDKELKELGYSFRQEKEARIQAWVEAGIKKGQIKNINPRLLTLLIVGIMGAVWVPIVLDNWEVDPEAAAQELLEIIMHGIAGSK